MKRLVSVRHGETLWNMDNRIQGSMDIPISGKGKEQAEALAGHLKDLECRFDAVYCSDLKRSRETCEILGSRFELPEPSVTPLLREIHCGDWEGLTVDQLLETAAEDYDEWRRNPFFRIPGGESIMDVRIRIEKFFQREKTALDKADRVLIVAHGLQNRMILSVVLNIDPQSARFFFQDNTAVNVFSWRHGCVFCDAWNLRCHLQEVAPC
jgi:broad specificity phosphatase PhoE